jgi:hypothetical protein
MTSQADWIHLARVPFLRYREYFQVGRFVVRDETIGVDSHDDDHMMSFGAPADI